MAETFSVRLEKEQLVFSAAHFITFAGGICERLHGHNWGVAAEVVGPLDENQYVVDFIALRDTLRELTAELDHRMLLPTGHPTIQVDVGETEIEVRFERRRWVFPKEDCAVLPISNTTAELLACHLGRRLLDELHRRYLFTPRRLSLQIDENYGQWGGWTWTADEPAGAS